MNNPDALTLLIWGLATWRIGVLFVYDTGPFEVFARLRHYTGWAVFSCMYCISMYVWIIPLGLSHVRIGGYTLHAVNFAFALSALAILLDSANERLRRVERIFAPDDTETWEPVS